MAAVAWHTVDKTTVGLVQSHQAFVEKYETRVRSL
jgi:hypothetical protein